MEDTDRARSTKESEAAVLEDLKWLGLDWDEGKPLQELASVRNYAAPETIFMKH